MLAQTRSIPEPIWYILIHHWPRCCYKCSWFGYVWMVFESTSWRVPRALWTTKALFLLPCCCFGTWDWQFTSSEPWFTIYSWLIECLPFPPSYASFRESWFREIVCLPTNAKPHPSAAASASAHILPRQWGFCSQPEKSEHNKSSTRPKLQQHWKYQQDFQQFPASSIIFSWGLLEVYGNVWSAETLAIISATFLAMPLQVSNAFMRSKLLVIGSSDFSSKTRQEHKAMMLLASMSAKTFWNTILERIETESAVRPDLHNSQKEPSHDTSWLWLRSMPHLDILDLHLHMLHFCIFLHISIYISMPACNSNSHAKSLGHEDLIRWGDLAGHSALELHHAIFVDEFQPSQHPSHCSKVVTHDLRQAARPPGRQTWNLEKQT